MTPVTDPDSADRRDATGATRTTGATGSAEARDLAAVAGTEADRGDRFGDDWLDLREAIDHRARAATAIERHLPPRDHWRALDLAGGTGSNLRYLMPRLGGRQHWWLIDHDPRLLAGAGERLTRWALGQGLGVEVDGDKVATVEAAAARVPPERVGTGRPGSLARQRWSRIVIDGADWQATIEPRRIDLERLDFLQALAGEDEPIDLVCGSALLDLVSMAWLSTLVDWCAANRASMLFALSYDGRITWSPERPDDEAVTAALERDQRRDKGMGIALGSAAAGRLRARLVARGMSEASAESDWDLDVDAVGRAVQRRLIEDWAALAASAGWRSERLALLHAGTSRLRVGHLDVVAWPARSGASMPGADHGRPGISQP